MTARILVVDDEPDLLELVRIHLANAGYAVSLAATGAEALDELRRARPDLVVLDLMLPDYSGTEVCRKIRSDPEFADIPVVMLTALSEEVDRVVGFELGADDYVTKPFSPRELVLRVKAILKRSEKGQREPELLEHGAIRIDFGRRRCEIAAAEVQLTAKEFELLATLMQRPGHVLTREKLLDTVWGSDVSVTLRTIDTHVRRLREKLGEAGSVVETVRGVGYRFTE